MTKTIITVEQETGVSTIEPEIVIISNEDGFHRSLPKWPQLVIVGEKVDAELAKEIIFRTDDFLTDACEYSGGNNRKFNAFYRKASGLDTLRREVTFDNKTHEMTDYQKSERLQEILNIIPLEYVYNRWASSCFIGGPAGFCSPEGNIFFCHNVGKYPEVEDVYNDFLKIATAFPTLCFNASLYDGEECEDDDKKSFVVGFIVENGVVTMTSTDIKLLDTVVDNDVIGRFIDRMSSDNMNMHELGLDTAWYDEFAKRVKVAVEQVHQEFQLAIEQEQK